MSGSEQFLGQQLTKQANALQELVLKMQQMVIAQESSIPKYSIASSQDNIAILVPSGVQMATERIKTMSIFFTGSLRLEGRFKNTGSSYENISITQNGTVVSTISLEPKAVNISKTIDITVKEGDILKYTSNNYIYTESDFKIGYKFINKPNINIA